MKRTTYLFLTTLLVPALPLVVRAEIRCELTSPQGQNFQVGQTVTVAANCSDENDGAVQYRFQVSPSPGTLPVMREFSGRSSFEWSPMQEGEYRITVTGRNRTTLQAQQAGLDFRIAPLVGSDQVPVIRRTRHPLVLLYSAPACEQGVMDVLYRPADAPAEAKSQATASLPCGGGLSRNFFVAGLRGETAYVMQYRITERVETAAGESPGQTRTRLGPLSDPVVTGVPSLSLPAAQLVKPASERSSAEPVLLQAFLAFGGPSGGTASPAATDLDGRLIWYYDAPPEFLYLVNPVAGGTFLVMPDLVDRLSEIDLAGNTLRETNIAVLEEEMRKRGGAGNVIGLHHDAVRLPNGYTAVLGFSDRLLPEQDNRNVLGDLILVLDRNWQLVWFWDSFDHLDTRRKAVLNTTCPSGQLGCPIFTLPATEADDWTHANSLQYLPDGHFLISVRHQDWVIKVNYADGAGDGSLIWRIGKDGDLRLTNPEVDAYPWFSHQHSALLQGNQLVVLDNGNTRFETAARREGQHSRGQVYTIDTSDPNDPKITLVLNADLGVYSPFIGNSHALSNGNFHFLLGTLNPGSQSFEIIPTADGKGSPDYQFRFTQNLAYRSFRLKDLYSAP